MSRQVEVQNPPKPYFTDYALLVNQILSITLAVFSVERLKSPTLRHRVSREAFHNHPNSPTHNPYRYSSVPVNEARERPVSIEALENRATKRLSESFSARADLRTAYGLGLRAGSALPTTIASQVVDLCMRTEHIRRRRGGHAASTQAFEKWWRHSVPCASSSFIVWKGLTQATPRISGKPR